MSNLAPCQGQVTSLPSTVPSDSGPPRWVHVSLSAWNTSPPGRGRSSGLPLSTSLACWSSSSSVVATFNELGHRPFLLWVGSVFDRLLPLAAFPGFASLSSFVVQGLTPGCRRRTLFSAMKCFDCSGVSSSVKIAFTGHTGSQARSRYTRRVDEELVRPHRCSPSGKTSTQGLVLDGRCTAHDHVRAW